MRAALLILALLAAPAAAEEVRLPGPDGVTLRALLIPPAEGSVARRPVVALHGCGGLVPGTEPLRLPSRERDWAARLSAAGHAVLFPDSFGSRGLGPACGIAGHPAPVALRREDALAAAAWLGARTGSEGGVLLLGWSQGGSTVLAAAEAPPPGLVAAAVALYPGCGALTFPRQPVPAVPVLMLLGGADDWTRPGPCLALAARHPERIAAHLFPGAHHGFDRVQPPRRMTLPSGAVVTQGGDPAARAAAIGLVEEFLARHAGPAPKG